LVVVVALDHVMPAVVVVVVWLFQLLLNLPSARFQLQ